MTVIITGNPRGGTTCVARVVNALGIPLIHDQENSMDWMKMQAVILTGQWDIVTDLLSQKTSHHLWGFKAPGIFGHLAGHLEKFEKPTLIYVVRDPIANADSVRRHRQSEDVLPDSVGNLANETCRALCLIPTWGVPYLFVSYEKIMTHTELTVKAISEFLGVIFCQDAVEEVRPNDPRYKLLKK